MAVFFAVFNQKAASGGGGNPGLDAQTDKALAQQFDATVVEVEGTAVADVQRFVRQKYGSTGTVVVVTEAQWKTS